MELKFSEVSIIIQSDYILAAIVGNPTDALGTEEDNDLIYRGASNHSGYNSNLRLVSLGLTFMFGAFICKTPYFWKL